MLQIPDSLIKKYSVVGPRYTSYPTAPMWKDISGEIQQQWFLDGQQNNKPISIYLHIPFCWNRCLYCGCNTLITKQQRRSDEYVEYLLREIDRIGQILQGERKVWQLHFGGGTPTFLLNEEFERLLNRIRELFPIEKDAEIAIEIDPCSTRPGQLDFLSSLGFNRMSLGVQDFNEKVQQAVNRPQSRKITLEHLTKAKQLGFKGVNFDLIYGLPFQTLENFEITLQEVIAMRPDRLALYNFAYLPEQMPHQRKIVPQSLPDEKTKLAILFKAIKEFDQAGYNYIGMDHFALPEDELSIAQNNRTLYRNFMGYTPKSGVDLIGIGASSISEFDNFFIQNKRKVPEYFDKMDQEGLSGARGILLSKDDKIRKWTILKLICHFYLSFDEFKQEFSLDFKEYFRDEIDQLKELIKDQLISIHPNHLEVLDYGKILVRNICMIFDAYLKDKTQPEIRYSKTI